MINPLDLPGPEFLVFYSAIIVVSAAPVYLHWLSLGRTQGPRRPMVDPYQIAYLRGGPREAVAVAVATLVHRKWLEVDQVFFKSHPGEELQATNRLERAILEQCGMGNTLEQLLEGKSTAVATELFHSKLVADGMILSDDQKRTVSLVKAICIAVLVILALLKFTVALQRGRHNVLFLLALMALGVFVHVKHSWWVTPSGRTALNDLRILFKRLRDKSRVFFRNANEHQFSFLVGVFGVAALSAVEYPFLGAMSFRQTRNAVGSSSCGSSGWSTGGCDGSSCSSGCGSGCGGCGS